MRATAADTAALKITYAIKPREDREENKVLVLEKAFIAQMRPACGDATWSARELK
jgi:hypothetical protein